MDKVQLTYTHAHKQWHKSTNISKLYFTSCPILTIESFQGFRLVVPLQVLFWKSLTWSQNYIFLYNLSFLMFHNLSILCFGLFWVEIIMEKMMKNNCLILVLIPCTLTIEVSCFCCCLLWFSYMNFMI